MKRLFQKFSDRHIWQSVVAYLAAAFVVLQAVDFFITKYGFEPKLLTYSLIVLCAGFPLAIVWSWRNNAPIPQSFDLTKTESHILAVMPFDHDSEDESLHYLATGIPENLINRLSVLQDLRVLSRTSTFALKNGERDASSVAKKLKADIMFTGQLMRNGNQLIVSCQLLDVHQKYQMWGEKISFALSDLFQMENGIVRTLMDQLPVSLATKSDVGKPEEKVNPEAYTHYLKGRYYSYGSTEEESQRAIDQFREAIQVDPTFSPAYIGIANEKVIQAIFGIASRNDILGEARVALQSAMAIAPDAAEVHMLDGSMKFYSDCDWEGAEAAYQKALKIEPNNAYAHIRYSAFLASMRRDEEALLHAQKAIEFDPISIPSLHNIGWAQMVARQFAASEQSFSEALKLYPSWIWGYVKRGYARTFQGKKETAIEDALKAKELMGEWGGEHLEFAVMFIHYRCGNTDLATELQAAYALKVTTENYNDPYALFFYFSMIGETEKAIEWAWRSWEEKSLTMYLTKVGLMIPDEVFNHPKFQALLKEMKLIS